MLRISAVFCALLSFSVPGQLALAGAATLNMPGDLQGSITFSQDCPSGVGVGLAYDGAGHLWFSCFQSNPDLYRASATTGAVDATYNVAGDLGALAYDAGRNAIWGAENGNIYLIKLDASRSVVSSSTAFSPGADAEGLVDGLAYDGVTDLVYVSPDTSTSIHVYHTNGVKVADFGWSGSACYNSGLGIGGNLLFEGSDGCSHVWVVDKNTLAPAFDFDTLGVRDEGLTCDSQTFAPVGVQVMWSKEAYSPNRASAFIIPPGTCGVGGASTRDYRLPWASGKWVYVTGPHGTSYNGPDALDFRPPAAHIPVGGTSCGSATGSKVDVRDWVYPMTPGTVTSVKYPSTTGGNNNLGADSKVPVTLFIQGEDGTKTYVTHLATTTVAVGDKVSYTTRLGHPSCFVEAGDTVTTIQVHYVIRSDTDKQLMFHASFCGWRLSLDAVTRSNSALLRSGSPTAYPLAVAGTNHLVSLGDCVAPGTTTPVVDDDPHMKTGDTAGDDFIVDDAAWGAQTLHVDAGPFQGDVDLTLIRPDASTVQPTDAGVTYSKTTGHVVYDIDGASSGTWTYSLHANSLPAGGADVNIRGVEGNGGSLKIAPLLHWQPPAGITYGVALSGSQLDATSDTPGSFTYAPPAGTRLDYGWHRLTAVFTPTDATHYQTGATVTASLFVKRRPVKIVTINQSVRYGLDFKHTFDNSSASVTGLASGDTPASLEGTISSPYPPGNGPGTYTLTPSIANGDYKPTFVTGILTVTKGRLTITANNKTVMYGSPLPKLTWTANFPSWGGKWMLQMKPSCSTTVPLDGAKNVKVPGGSAYPITCSGAAAAWFNLSYAAGTLTVAPATTVLTYQGPSSFASGAKATFKASLATSRGAMVPGRLVNFTLTVIDETATCSAKTSVAGIASCSIGSLDIATGPGTVSMSFAGDAPAATYYAASSGSASVQVN